MYWLHNEGNRLRLYILRMDDGHLLGEHEEECVGEYPFPGQYPLVLENECILYLDSLLRLTCIDCFAESTPTVSFRIECKELPPTKKTNLQCT